MNKLIGIGVLVAILAAVGGYFYPLSGSPAPQAGTSTAGSTFGTAKVALMAMVPSTSAATTTSILNGDASDRMINSIEIACGGLGAMLGSGNGVATFTLKLATTSTANNGLQGNTNLVGTTITISTSTPDIVISSSTPSLAGNNFFSDRWAAGTYLTSLLNSTSTAVCTVGVRYIPT